MEEQIWARSVIGDKAKIVKNRERNKETACVCSLDGLLIYQLSMSAAWLSSHLLPPTPFTSTSQLWSSPVTNCSHHLQSLSLFPGNNQWVSWINFLSSVFSILCFIVFPLSSHTVVSHLPWPSCHASGQGLDSQSEWCKPVLFFFSTFVLVFHLHPALALLTFYHVTLPPLSRAILSVFVSLATSLPENFTLLLLFSREPLCLLLCGSCYCQPVGGRRREQKNESELWAIFTH